MCLSSFYLACFILNVPPKHLTAVEKACYINNEIKLHRTFYFPRSGSNCLLSFFWKSVKRIIEINKETEASAFGEAKSSPFPEHMGVALTFPSL